jgi:2-iminobutanoate/2-iminopropanoate deaminase
MKKAISTDKAPKAVGPYSQGIEAGGFLFLSMQLPLDPKTGELAGTDARAQARQVFRTIGALLESAGAGYRDLVRTTLYLADMNDFAAVNEVYTEFLTEVPPARAAFQAVKLPKNALVAIDAIAFGK